MKGLGVDLLQSGYRPRGMFDGSLTKAKMLSQGSEPIRVLANDIMSKIHWVLVMALLTHGVEAGCNLYHSRKKPPLKAEKLDSDPRAPLGNLRTSS